MTRNLLAIAIALAFLTVGCGSEASTDGDRSDAGTPEQTAGLQRDALKPLFVGTWDYAMRYPSGDEVQNVRRLDDDGTGSQWNKEAGEASTTDFRWEITEDGKTLKLHFSEIMISEYGIVRATATEHVLKNTHGLDETCIKR